MAAQATAPVAKQQSVTAIYNTLEQAESTVRALDQVGFPVKQVTILAKDIQDERKVHGYVTACDVSCKGAQTGAWVGGIFGLLVGAAFVWVPGVGPLVIAGSLVAALGGGLEGAVAGAAVGGVLSGLAAWGISKEHIIKYEETVKSGKYVVIAHGTAAEVSQAESVLRGSKAVEVTPHAA
jgi:hypothetical protein